MTPESFLAKHGFPGTPAGDRMKADLEELLDPDIVSVYSSESTEPVLQYKDGHRIARWGQLGTDVEHRDLGVI